MTPSDLPAVDAIAAAVHPSYPEDAAVFAERLRLYPQGCRVLERGGAIMGYVISHPWAGAPPALNTLLRKLPAAPTTYYIHDLALLPAARRGGATRAIVAALIGHARQNSFATVALVAVNGSEAFWRKYGFQTVQDQNVVAQTQSYGTEARVMRAILSPA